jgi:tetratricopeptide (TPR) repeat protein
LSIIKIVFPAICFLLIASQIFSEDLKKNSSLQQPWDYYLKQGILQFNAGMYNYSIDNFQKTLEGNPECYEALNYMGKLFLLKNEYKKALESFEKSLEINKSQEEILIESGKLHDLFLNKDAALSRFKSAVEINNQNAEAHLNLVRHYYRLNDKEKSLYHLKESADISRRTNITCSIESQPYIKSKKYDYAIAMYLKDINKNPGNINIRYELHELYRKKKDFIKAAEILEQIIYLIPFEEKAYIYLGHIYFDEKISGNRKYHLERSIKFFKKALELNPDNADIYINLSMIYRLLKNDVMAEEMSKKADKLNH